MQAEGYSIADFAGMFQVTRRTLRFYETKGILIPRRQGVMRLYSDRDKVRLELALRGRRLGFSLEEVREIIEMYDPAQPDDPRQLVFLLRKLHQKRHELIRKFNDLQETLKAMDRVEARALEALSRRPRAQHAKTPQITLDLGIEIPTRLT
jgi:DNA-binding transcriptional MerR regulator